MSTVKTNAIEPASGGTVAITGAALTTPALGTPASGTLTNCTGFPVANLSGTTMPSAVVNSSLNAITPSGGALTITGTLSTVGVVSSSRYLSTSSSAALPAYGVEAGSGIFNAGASTIGFSVGSSEQMRLTSTGLGIGTSSPAVKLHSYTSGNTPILSETSGGVTSYLGLKNTGGMAYIASQNNNILFATSSNADTRATLDASGNLLVGTNTGSHHVFEKNNASNYATSTINSSATTPNGHRILLSGATGGAGGYFISCQDNAARFQVLGNGNVENVNNSYGAISDAKLKRDVTDTGPKLSKVLAMRIVNYFLIADPTNTKLLGMIAQELREISPGLVEENPDYEDVIVEPARTDTVTRQRQKTEARTVTQWKVEVRDGVAVRSPVEVIERVPLFVDLPLVGEDGQPIMDVVDGKPVPAMFRQPVMEDYTETVDVPAKIERRETGAVTLSIKYSILVPMLVKALQELHADFDQRLAALES